MFSARGMEKRNGSWGTTATARRSSASSIAPSGAPERRMEPSGTGWSRASRRSSVVFPDPTGPTIPTTEPWGARKEIPSSAGRAAPS